MKILRSSSFSETEHLSSLAYILHTRSAVSELGNIALPTSLNIFNLQIVGPYAGLFYLHKVTYFRNQR